MIEATTAATLSPFERLMLILCGAEKSGKSRTAATARKPVLFHDFDKRREALAGIKDVYCLTYIDEARPNIQPTGFQDYLSVLTKLESGYTLKRIGEDFGIKDWPDVRPKTQVLDSLASCGKCAMAYALYTNKDIRRTIAVGGQQIHFPGGWDAWNAETESTFSSVMRILAMKDQDIILIFHEAPGEMPDSTAEKPKFNGKIDLYPGRYRIFNKYFNEVWRVSRETGQQIPTIQVQPDFRFPASTNLDFSKITPQQLNPPGGPNIQELIKLVTGKP